MQNNFLAKFKKIKSDKHSTTLRHEDGHELRIAHEGIKPILKQQLDKLPMAKGGEVKRYAYAGPVDGGGGDDTPAAAPNTPMQDLYNNQASARAEQMYNPAPDMAPMDHDYSDRLFSGGKPPENFDSKAWVAAEQQAKMQAAQQTADAQSARMKAEAENAVRARAGLAPVDVPTAAGQPMNVASLNPAISVQDSRNPATPDQQSLAPANNDPFGMEQATNAQISAIGEQKLGAQQMAAAQGNLGRLQAASEGNYQTQAQQNMATYNQANQALSDERNALTQDIQNRHIDPEQYIKNMSTGARILQGIGLVLGGMGAGITGGPNLAYNKMQTEIDRDIQAQAAELGKKQNLLSNNMAQTGNLRAATELTRMQTNDILSSHLKQQAYAAQDPIQKANLTSLSGQFDGQSAQLQHQLAMQKVMMGQGGQQDPENMFKMQTQYLRANGQDKFAEDLEKKHVTGVGQANREVTDKDRSELVSRQDLANKVADLQQFAAHNSGSLNPAVINQGAAKAALVQDAYRRANAQGVFREAEKDFVSSIASPNPTQFFEKYRSGQGYQEMGRDNMASLNQLKYSYGLPGAQAPQGASSQQTKTVGGKTYIRGK